MTSPSIFGRAKERRLNLARSFEARVKQPTGMGVGEAIANDPGRGGVNPFVSPQRQRREREAYSLFRNWVYVSVNAVCKRLGGQPITAAALVDAPPNPERALTGIIPKRPGLFQPPAKAQRMPLDADFVRQRVPGRVLDKATVEQELEVIPSHPALDVLCRPNPIQRKFEFLYFSAANLLLTGQAYWIGGVAETDNGPRVEMWAVPTSWVTPLHEDGLFTGYRVQTSSTAEPMILPPENVARTYFPDPSDLKASLSPLSAIISAVRIDDAIQSSQEQMFERGINPNLMVTVGRVRGPDGNLTDRRPRLSGGQRRQIIRAIREVWGNSVNAGDPAIIDGLIESVHKLQMTPAEMDWLQSGDVVKRRIMQAFGVNPIVVGEIVGANRAQAVEADKQFCTQAVNPIVDAFSETATDFLGPMYEEPTRLVIWVEPCQPVDPDLDQKRWSEARKNGDVTRNEFRTEQLGLPPLEEMIERNVLLSSQGGMQGTVQILSAVGDGKISREQAAVALQLFLEVDEDTAEMLAGVGQEEEIETLPPPPEPEEPVDDEEILVSDEEDELEMAAARDAAIDLSVTSGMIEEAKRGLAWREEFGRGGTQVGVTRANQIIRDKKLSAATWRRVKAYFDRHQSDSDAEGWRPGEDGYPSAGRIAWALWGGDSGWARAKAIVRRLNQEQAASELEEAEEGPWVKKKRSLTD